MQKATRLSQCCLVAAPILIGLSRRLIQRGERAAASPLRLPGTTTMVHFADRVHFDRIHLDRATLARVNSAVMLGAIVSGLAACAVGALIIDIGRLFSIW